ESHAYILPWANPRGRWTTWSTRKKSTATSSGCGIQLGIHCAPMLDSLRCVRGWDSTENERRNPQELLVGECVNGSHSVRLQVGQLAGNPWIAVVPRPAWRGG